MLQYIKYLNVINLAYIANHIVGRVLAASVSNAPEVDLEFRQACKWRPLKEGFEEAKVHRKPICLFIQKVGCPACVKLKAKFCKSIKLVELTNQFVMINVEVSKAELGNATKFQPDGKYVPRILFFTPDGDLIKEAYNHHQLVKEKTKYFYSNASQIIESMLLVLNHYSDQPLTTNYKFDNQTRGVEDVDDDFMRPTMLD